MMLIIVDMPHTEWIRNYKHLVLVKWGPNRAPKMLGLALYVHLSNNNNKKPPKVTKTKSF